MMPVLALVLLAGQVRVEGLSDRAPDRISIFTVRDKGIATPLIAFQEKAREEVEAHLHAQLVSMDEMFTRGDLSYQAMVDCRGDPACFAKLIGGAVDARYLLVITASMIADARLLGARLIDLSERNVVGEALGEIGESADFVDEVPSRIKSAVPEGWWDPFGSLVIEVNEAGAQLTVNDRVVGLSPIGSLGYLLPGQYVVRAQKEGFTPFEASAEVSRGASARITIALAPVASESNSLWWLWTGIAVLAVAGGATALAFALRGDDSPASFCTAPDPSRCR
jgi:hypothetical protein